MGDASVREQVRICAEYRMAHRVLRGQAYTALVFGAIAVLMGLAYIRFSVLNGALVAVGLFLFAGGVMAFRRPGPLAMAMAGWGIALAGLWNIYIGVDAIAAGQADRNVVWLVFGITQMGWGAGILSRRSSLTRAAAAEIPMEMMEQVGDLVEAVQSSGEGTSGRHIEFNKHTFLGSGPYSGMLADDIAIFVENNGPRVYCAAPADVDIRLVKKRLLPKGNKASLRIGRKKFAVLISEESFKRLRAWLEGDKTSAGAPLPIREAAPEPREALEAAMAEEEGPPEGGTGEEEPSPTERLAAFCGAVTDMYRLQRSVRRRCIWTLSISLALCALFIVAATSSRAGGAPSPMWWVVFGGFAFIALSSIYALVRGTMLAAMVPAAAVAAACTAALIASAIAGKGGAVIWMLAAGGSVRFIIGANRARRAYDAYIRQEQGSMQIREAHRLLRTIISAKVRDNLDVVAFKAVGSGKWKGLLLADAAVFVRTGAYETVVVRRGLVTVEPRKRCLFRKASKAVVRMGSTVEYARIADASRERIEKWNARDALTLSEHVIAAN